VEIREAIDDDWPAIWPFFREIANARETYAYDPEIDEEQARELWMVGPPARTVVAVDDRGEVLGSASMYPNRPGPGSHVASASFMVDAEARGRGVGRALGDDFLNWARSQGYRAAQFNAVVETNTAAVALWRTLGFQIVGTVPEAFCHPRAGFVALHVMHRPLDCDGLR
jgi:L-amino acid N-acyltransferase YncA